ncbi:hypothetical protein B484DRAFT_173208 [Ochromonadaceae sp. CCMP2298]|nr:hypothetical protein B484DRAFT_173208 [Ochromonadaceae sp. CCMP2298]
MAFTQSLNPSIRQSLNHSIPQSLDPSIPRSLDQSTLNPSIPQSYLLQPLDLGQAALLRGGGGSR